MVSKAYQLLSLVMVALMFGASHCLLKVEETKGNRSTNLLHVIWNDLLREYMDSCYIVLVTERSDSPNFNVILRSIRDSSLASVILDLHRDSYSTEDLMQKLIDDEDKVTCRVFIFDLLSSSSVEQVLMFMKRIKFFLIPNASAVFLGLRSLLYEALGAGELRNTANALYLVVDDIEDDPTALQLDSTATSVGNDVSESLGIYHRCFFCENGGPAIKFVDKLSPETGFLWGNPVFEDQFGDMKGWQLNIIQMDWYPLVGFIRDSDEVPTTVTPLEDTMNVRMLKAISKALNFTYEMRIPWDEQWGVFTESGNWTGMIGTLQHHKADFGMEVTYLLGRMKVVDYTRIHIYEPLIMVMSKPRPPPQYLAIIRPLSGDLWIAILVSSLSAGLILWALQLGWENASSQKGLSFDIALLYTWSILFEEPADKLPTNGSSLMFLGCWWMYCTLISVTYKSSLIAHLTVPAKSTVIDTFEEMLEEDGWTWGYWETHTFFYDAFRTSASPVVNEVYERMVIQDINEQFERVLTEQHVLMISRYMFNSLDSTHWKDRFGVSPFYQGKAEYFANGDGWAFRQNAPFYNAIDTKIQQLIETGHTALWTKMSLGMPLYDPCEGDDCEKDKKDDQEGIPTLNTDANVVLSLNHLQSAFYVQILGLSIASMAFVAEYIYSTCVHKEYQEKMPKEKK